jgi:hypothetical protein
VTVTDNRTRPGARERGRPRGRRPVPTSPFFTSALDGAPRWAVGALTALQGALLSLLVIVLPAIAAYVATSADPSNAGVGWTRAVRVGSAVWLAGHGVPLHVAGVTIGLVPLGVTGLAVFACYASARRSGVPSRSAFAAGVATYLATAGLVAQGVGVSGADSVRGMTGALLVSVLGLGGGLLRRHDSPAWRDVTRGAWSRVAAPVRCGAAAGLLAGALLLATVACLVLLWIAAGRATIGDVVTGLHMDVVGGAVLAYAELAFLPNLVGWALAWLAGPGFHVGAGTHFAPGEATTGPMPAIPLLGALPTGDFAGPAARLAPIVLVLAGLAAGWYVHRRLVGRRWHDVVAAGGTAALTTALLALALVALSSGPAGPGRLAHVGATAWAVGLSVGAGVLLGALAIAVPLDEQVRAGVRRLFGGRRDDGPAGEPVGASRQASSGAKAPPKPASKAAPKARATSEKVSSATSPTGTRATPGPSGRTSAGPAASPTPRADGERGGSPSASPFDVRRD